MRVLNNCGNSESLVARSSFPLDRRFCLMHSKLCEFRTTFRAKFISWRNSTPSKGIFRYFSEYNGKIKWWFIETCWLFPHKSTNNKDITGGSSTLSRCECLNTSCIDHTQHGKRKRVYLLKCSKYIQKACLCKCHLLTNPLEILTANG